MLLLSITEPVTCVHTADDPVHPGDADGDEGAREKVVRGGWPAGEVRGDVIPGQTVLGQYQEGRGARRAAS